MHVLIIEGPPMGGKGSQADMLVESMGYTHLDCGHILRSDPAFQHLTSQGELIPDTEVIDLVLHELPVEFPEHLVITGFPRSMGQANWLRTYLSAQCCRVSVILLRVNEAELIGRLPKRKEEDDRPDDEPQVFQKRLEKYRKYGPEMRRFLTHNYTHLIQIDGNRSKESVSRDVLRFIDDELEEIRAHEAHEQDVHRPSALTAF